MNEEELRGLIRHAIQKHLGESGTASPHLRQGSGGQAKPQTASQVSISFGQYQLERAPDDTMCLIEPAVRCNHCGFCKCHGH